ncbi:MAG: ABC transporter substrate-binding protein [Clostridia bacterium]|jgi:spermidine/putrescine transport system substrate-binding protein
MTKKVGVLFLALIMISVMLLPGCDDENTLYVYNWGDYMDMEVIKMFEKETGIKVRYQTYTTNEDMYVKLKSGSAKYDVIFPSDYMLDRMVQEGLVQKIDLNNIPNFALINDIFKDPEYDPGNQYSVPYLWGTVGILYNKKMVQEPVDSWNILWDKKYEKKILMVDSQRDSLGVALKRLGYSMNTTNTKEVDEAKNSLIEQKPLVLAYIVDEARDKMANEEAALAVVWSGEAILAMEMNEDLAFAYPKEGSNIWYDVVAIPATSTKKELAEKFINFLCRTDIAYMNAVYTGYSSPQIEVYDLLDEDIQNNPAAYPSEEVIKNCEVFKYLGDFVEYYNRAWMEVTAN